MYTIHCIGGSMEVGFSTEWHEMSTTSQLSGRIIQTQATATAATFGILESFLTIIPKVC